jgi:hypothetical protein
MKEQFNHMDDFLRKSMDEFHAIPSPNVWRRINLNLSFAGLKYTLIALAFIVVLVAGYFLFDPSHELKTTNENSLQISENKLAAEAIPDNPVETVKKFVAEEIDKNNTANVSSQKIKAEANDEVSLENKDKFVIQSNSISEPLTESSLEANEINPRHINHFKSYPGLTRISIPFGNETKDNSLNQQFELFDYQSLPEILSLRYDLSPDTEIDYIRMQEFYLGIQAGPEWIFTSDPYKSVKTALNIDATLIYKWNDQFIQGGIGVAFSEDDGLFEANYAQYDSIGFYYQVNGFTIDPQTGRPVYKTSVENVFDTIDYVQTAQVKNIYTYLRIPFYYGIDAYKFKQFSLSLKGGIIGAIMIDKNEQDWAYNNENALKLKVSNNTRERIRTNVQLSLGVGMDYTISNRLYLSLDPLLNYYMSPIYSRQYQSGYTFSFGCKAGLIIKL